MAGEATEQVSDNENQTRDGEEFPSSGIDAGGPGETDPASAAAIAHAKPSLTVEQQVAHLKSQGVTFGICGEREASGHLANANSYLRTRSYRVLYPRRPDGTYIGLDFAALRGLASLDRQLKMAFLGTCIDTEHFAKVKVLRMAEERGEDGLPDQPAHRCVPLRARHEEHQVEALEAREPPRGADGLCPFLLIVALRARRHARATAALSVQFRPHAGAWRACFRRTGHLRHILTSSGSSLTSGSRGGYKVLGCKTLGFCMGVSRKRDAL